MAGIAVAPYANPQPYRVLVAIDPELLDQKFIAAGLALAPETFAGAGPEMGDAGLEGFPDRLGVHIGQQQRFAGLGIGRDGRHEAVGVEA